jgi:hypothetical protein
MREVLNAGAAPFDRDGGAAQFSIRVQWHKLRVRARPSARRHRERDSPFWVLQLARRFMKNRDTD